MTDKKLIFVEWHDAFGVSSDWQEITDVVKETKPLLVRSVGWEIHRDDSCLVIVPHLSDVGHDRTNQQGCGDMTIPVACIVREQEIKLKKASQ